MKIFDAAVIEVSRGQFVESQHEVDIVVADADGSIVSGYGEVDKGVFPRSSIKALQAVPLVESGAADEYGFGDEHLALACSSHNGQPDQIETACNMLHAAGLGAECLECGAQLPGLVSDQKELFLQNQEATQLHNTCSGKHAGFLAFAKYTGKPTSGYVNIDHLVQREIAGVLEAVTECAHNNDNHAIDGCSIPTYQIPLSQLAKAFAKISVGKGTGPGMSAAMIRLQDACMARPDMVAGKKRVCTKLMTALPGRVCAKFGAEGVYTATLPELGLGIAMKARDGSARSVEVAVSTLVCQLLDLEPLDVPKLRELTHPKLTNRCSIEVGELRMAN